MKRCTKILVIVLIAMCATPAFAGLKVTDNGYKVTATSGDGRTFSQEDKGYTVEGTPPDTEKALAIVMQKNAQSAEGLDQAIAVVLNSGILLPKQPTRVYVPYAVPCPRPVQPVCVQPAPPVCAPRTLPCQPEQAPRMTTLPCRPTSADARDIRQATIRVRWTSASRFKAYVNGRDRTFIVPSNFVTLYRSKPTTLSGWLYNSASRRNCPLMFRHVIDAQTCVDIVDP